MRPIQIVPSADRKIRPVGIEMISVVTRNGPWRLSVHAADEHVVGPDDAAQRNDAEKAADRPPVGEQRLAREVGQDLQRDAEARQHDDVDRRVGVEPEDVLVEDRVAAVRRR